MNIRRVSQWRTTVTIRWHFIKRSQGCLVHVFISYCSEFRSLRHNHAIIFLLWSIESKGIREHVVIITFLHVFLPHTHTLALEYFMMIFDMFSFRCKRSILRYNTFHCKYFYVWCISIVPIHSLFIVRHAHWGYRIGGGALHTSDLRLVNAFFR